MYEHEMYITSQYKASIGPEDIFVY